MLKNLIFFFRRLKLRSQFIRIESGVLLGKNVHLNNSSVFFKSRRGSIVLKRNCKISNYSNIQSYGGTITIDEFTFIGEFVSIYGHGNVHIGKNCLIALGTTIVSSNHTIPNRKQLINQQANIKIETHIGDDVWIGANVVILAGVTIGSGCIIGAGSVVTKSIPDYSIAVGNPARITKTRN